MTFYAALDVSLDKTAVCVMGRDGSIVREMEVATCPETLARCLGKIAPTFELIGGFVKSKVLDNGSAREDVQPGRGLKIIGELVKALHGRLEQKFGLPDRHLLWSSRQTSRRDHPARLDRSVCEIRHAAAASR